MSLRDYINENIAYHLDERVIASTVKRAYTMILGTSRGKAEIQLTEDFVDSLVDEMPPEIRNEDDRKFWVEELGAHASWACFGPDQQPVLLGTLRPDEGECTVAEFAHWIPLVADEPLIGVAGRGCRARLEEIRRHCKEHLMSLSFTVRVKMDVCSTCEGHGHVVNPSIDAGGLTRDDFDNDPDFEQDYLGGTYDITCPQCKGLRVVPTLDGTGYLVDLIRSYESRQLEMAYEDADARAYGY